MAPYTSSKEDAMRLLTRVRGKHIADARVIADELIAKKGSAHVGEVYPIMVERGLIDFSIPQHWLGAVFSLRKKYRWTGETVQTKIGHDVLAKVWVSAREPWDVEDAEDA